MHRPTDHQRVVQIEHHAKKQLALPCGDLRYIRDPAYVPALGAEITIQQAFHASWTAVGNSSGVTPLPTWPALNSLGGHQASNAVQADGFVPSSGRSSCIRGAQITPTAVLEARILLGTWAWLAMLPGVIAAGRNLQTPAHHPYRALSGRPRPGRIGWASRRFLSAVQVEGTACLYSVCAVLVACQRAAYGKDNPAAEPAQLAVRVGARLA